jgi:RNA polymerase sigma-70 factor (ECF subfamily)
MSRRIFKARRDATGRSLGLLARARTDPELFAEFYAENYEQILAFFARRILDPETAFDLMAETFAAAYAALPSFRGRTDVEGYAWVWAIARNQLYRWRDRGEVERRSLAKLGIELPSMSTVEFERVEELAGLDRLKQAIADALEALGIDQRDAVRLRVVEERPYDEIAQSMGVSEDVARARVSRGLRELGRMLETREGFEGLRAAS